MFLLRVREDVVRPAAAPALPVAALHLKSTHSYKTCWIFLPFAFWS